MTRPNQYPNPAERVLRSHLQFSLLILDRESSRPEELQPILKHYTFVLGPFPDARVQMSSSLRSDVPRRVSSAKERSRSYRSKTGDMSVATMLQPASRGSTSTNSSFEPVSRQNTFSSHDGARSLRQSKRVSMTALYASMSAKDKDLEISDDLARAQRTLRDLKAKISNQSKKNFVLEKDVRYLDSRIALLIQNRMALEEVCHFTKVYEPLY